MEKNIGTQRERKKKKRWRDSKVKRQKDGKTQRHKKRDKNLFDQFILIIQFFFAKIKNNFFLQ